MPGAGRNGFLKGRLAILRVAQGWLGLCVARPKGGVSLVTSAATCFVGAANPPLPALEFFGNPGDCRLRPGNREPEQCWQSSNPLCRRARPDRVTGERYQRRRHPTVIPSRRRKKQSSAASARTFRPVGADWSPDESARANREIVLRRNDGSDRFLILPDEAFLEPRSRGGAAVEFRQVIGIKNDHWRSCPRSCGIRGPNGSFRRNRCRPWTCRR